MAERSLDAYEAKLQDSSVDIKTKGSILTEIRDQVDSWSQSPAYSTFLQKFVPIFLDILSGSPVFTSNSPEQIYRQRPLEILQRLPLSSTDGSIMEPYAEKLVDRCLELVKIETTQ